jgi:hypothetical protein
MPRYIPFDYSTMNLEELRKLPTVKLSGYRLQREDYPGDGLYCPGFPGCFTRAISNSHGNWPRLGHPRTVITDPEYHRVHYVVDDIDLRTLWIPLPYPTGERIWEIFDDQEPDPQSRRLYEWIYGWYAHWRGKQHIPPEEHGAVISIQKFYPEHQPHSEWIKEAPPWKPQNDWWIRYNDPSLVVRPGASAAYK